MKFKIKKYIALSLALISTLLLCSCGKKDKNTAYKDYVKSLIGINYLGATDDYIESTGCNKEDAIALYNTNINVLTDSILSYYGVTLPEGSELREEYFELAKKIYSKVDYSVSKPYTSDDTTKLDVEIKPINIFEQTKAEVILYIDSFNVRVANGEFNEYTVDMYNEVFAKGLLTVLNNCCENIEYAAPTKVTVTIIENGDTFYISDADFLAIDAAILAVSATAPVTATDSDAN